MGIILPKTDDVSQDLPRPPCSLFYNYMPNAELIPASTLPIRGADGAVSRPQGWRAAHVIPLRGLPVVSAEVKINAQRLIADAKKSKRSGVSVDDEDKAKAVAAAKSLLSNPSLSSSHSSCFLISLLVDEQGRGASSSKKIGDGKNVSGGVDSDSGGNTGGSWRTMHSSQSSPVLRGIDFLATNSLLSSPASSESDACSLNSCGNGAACLARGGNRGAALREDRSAEGELVQPDLSFPHNSQTHPQQVSSTSDAARYDTGLVLSVTSVKKPVSAAGPTTHAVQAIAGDEDGATSSAPPLRPLLVKESHFRRNEDNSKESSAPAAQGFSNGGARTANGASPHRIRRTLSRITLILQPQRTRWFFFNDSATHEAQVSAIFFYETEKKHGSSIKPDAGKEALSTLPSEDAAASAPAIGDLRIVCRPTPVSHTAISPDEVQQQSISGGGRCYVEVNRVPLGSVAQVIPTPSTLSQVKELNRFKSQVDGAAAVEVFLALAPGETVWVAEGAVLGYRIDTHHIPFVASDSIATFGNTLTPELVRAFKHKAAAPNKKKHRYVFVSLKKAGKASPETASLGGHTPAASPPHAADTEPKVADTAFSIDKVSAPPQAASVHSSLRASLKTLASSAGSAGDAAAAKISAAQHENELPDSAPVLWADRADAAALSPGGTKVHLSPLSPLDIESVSEGPDSKGHTADVTGGNLGNDTPAIPPSTAVAAGVEEAYCYNYDYSDMSTGLTAASTFQGLSLEETTVVGAVTKKNDAALVQLSEAWYKSLTKETPAYTRTLPADVPVVVGAADRAVADRAVADRAVADSPVVDNISF